MTINGDHEHEKQRCQPLDIRLFVIRVDRLGRILLDDPDGGGGAYPFRIRHSEAKWLPYRLQPEFVLCAPIFDPEGLLVWDTRR